MKSASASALTYPKTCFRYPFNLLSLSLHPVGMGRESKVEQKQEQKQEQAEARALNLGDNRMLRGTV